MRYYIIIRCLDPPFFTGIHSCNLFPGSKIKFLCFTYHALPLCSIIDASRSMAHSLNKDNVIFRSLKSRFSNSKSQIFIAIARLCKMNILSCLVANSAVCLKCSILFSRHTDHFISGKENMRYWTSGFWRQKIVSGIRTCKSANVSRCNVEATWQQTHLLHFNLIHIQSPQSHQQSIQIYHLPVKFWYQGSYHSKVQCVCARTAYLPRMLCFSSISNQMSRFVHRR